MHRGRTRDERNGGVVGFLFCPISAIVIFQASVGKMNRSHLFLLLGIDTHTHILFIGQPNAMLNCFPHLFAVSTPVSVFLLAAQNADVLKDWSLRVPLPLFKFS